MTRPNDGFSLLELSAVLIIVALVAGMSLSVGQLQVASSKITGTRNDLDTVRRALLLYRAKSGRLPCPASRDAAKPSGTSAVYGLESGVCALHQGCPSGVVCPSDGIAAIGAVPFRTLGIAEENSMDRWGKRLTYAVDRGLTVPIAAAGGRLQVVDASGRSMTRSPIFGDALFAVLSHGPTGVGARNGSGTVNVLCNTATLDGENCNDDGVFRDARATGSDTAARFYDDQIVWASETADGTAPISGNLSAPSTFVPRRFVPGTALISSSIDGSTRSITLVGWDGRLYASGTSSASDGPWNGIADSIVGFRPVDGEAARYNDWVQVQGDTNVNCALRATGDLYCTGRNNVGQAGNGTNTPVGVFTRVPLDGVTQFAVSTSNTCALDRQKRVWCWGDNQWGQLGIGATTPSWSGVPNLVTDVGGGSGGDWTFVMPMVSAVDNTSAVCGIRTGGRVWCWGRASNKQFGDGTIGNRTNPTLGASGMTGFTQLASNGGFCGLRYASGSTVGEVWCWGNNDDGTGSLPLSADDEYMATRVGTDASTSLNGVNDWKAVSMGRYAGCLLRRDGKPFCWSNENYAKIGAGGSAAPDLVPVSGDLHDIVSIGGAGDDMCFMRPDGSFLCAGSNHNPGSGSLQFGGLYSSAGSVSTPRPVFAPYRP